MENHRMRCACALVQVSNLPGRGVPDSTPRPEKVSKSPNSLSIGGQWFTEAEGLDEGGRKHGCHTSDRNPGRGRCKPLTRNSR